jgi:hypothetical protein
LHSVLGGSLFLLVSTIYPEHDWASWKFKNLPKNYIPTSQEKNSILQYLKTKLKIEKKSDWENIKYVVTTINYT